MFSHWQCYRSDDDEQQLAIQGGLVKRVGLGRKGATKLAWLEDGRRKLLSKPRKLKHQWSERHRGFRDCCKKFRGLKEFHHSIHLHLAYTNPIIIQQFTINKTPTHPQPWYAYANPHRPPTSSLTTMLPTSPSSRTSSPLHLSSTASSCSA